MKTIRPSFKSFKEKALENPEIKAEYEALQPIFELKFSTYEHKKW